MSCSLRLKWLLASLALAVLPGHAATRFNLPQAKNTVWFSEHEKAELQALWEGMAVEQPPVFSDRVTQILLAALPEDFRASCEEMHKPWGVEAQGTARWTVHGLYHERDTDRQRITALLAYRCTSTHPRYAQYYDEHPALLTLDPVAGRLRLVTFAEESHSSSELFDLSFSRVIPVEGGRLVELLVQGSGDNPCCGPRRWRRELLLYLLLPAAEMALWVERQRTERFKPFIGGGTGEETCVAEIRNIDDSLGRLEEIQVVTRCKSGPETERVTTHHYRWDGRWREFGLICSTDSPNALLQLRCPEQ